MIGNVAAYTTHLRKCGGASLENFGTIVVTQKIGVLPLKFLGLHALENECARLANACEIRDKGPQQFFHNKNSKIVQKFNTFWPITLGSVVITMPNLPPPDVL